MLKSLRFVLALMMLLHVAAAAQDSTTDEATSHYLLGEKAFKAGDYVKAVQEWRVTLKLKPESDYTTKMLARAEQKCQEMGYTVPQDVEVNPKDGAEMVWVPAGEFLMGSTDEQVARQLKADARLKATAFDDEKPQRRIYLDGYWMYKTEVTVAQYRKFCKATKREMPAAPPWGWKEDHPVVNVSWHDAANYAEWAGASLPTEAQWEKAARGTDGRMYPWGNEWDGGRCANSVSGSLTGTKPVGSYPSGASPYGCLDMAGNVWEWCADWYDGAYYGNEAPSRNPPGPAEASSRVLRGGSWYYDYRDVYFRCAARFNFNPDNRVISFGFRCSRTP